MKIMVCYDGTDAAKSALSVTVQQAKAFHAEVIAVTSMEGNPQEQLHDIKKAEKTLADAGDFITAEGLACETKLLLSETHFSAGEILVRYANQEKMDMIVIGVKKRSKVGKMITGSNAQHVILNSDCQVVCVK